METLTQNFKRDELAELKLRRLYEHHGFCRVKTGKFEEYSLYVENKNFLDTEGMITFMDMDGRLMALKPDATLSVVKNMPKQLAPSTQKLYYMDEVYRLAKESREYKVHRQIGVEIIGESDPCANLEIVDLALDSLAIIGEPFALDISHLGFVSGLLSGMGLSPRMEGQVLENIHAKNSWDVLQLLEQAEVSDEQVAQVLALTSIHGEFTRSLARAKELICNEQMRLAYEELERVASVVDGGQSGSVNLDFSVISNLDYYNGLIFRGYVEGVPTMVLSGGRYDNLLRKMKRKGCAIGFGISLDILGAYLKRGKRYDWDMLVTYDARSDFAALLALVRKYVGEGKRVRLEREESDLSAAGFTAARHCRFADGKWEEASSC